MFRIIILLIYVAVLIMLGFMVGRYVDIPAIDEPESGIEIMRVIDVLPAQQIQHTDGMRKTVVVTVARDKENNTWHIYNYAKGVTKPKKGGKIKVVVINDSLVGELTIVK